ncbi:MAG: hypothetical protein ACXW4Z_18900, partial [Candidatus Binatia bacterium]
ASPSERLTFRKTEFRGKPKDNARLALCFYEKFGSSSVNSDWIFDPTLQVFYTDRENRQTTWPGAQRRL